MRVVSLIDARTHARTRIARKPPPPPPPPLLSSLTPQRPQTQFFADRTSLGVLASLLRQDSPFEDIIRQPN